jgi:poly(3-hydroxybutyrate) depolymerase
LDVNKEVNAELILMLYAYHEMNNAALAPVRALAKATLNVFQHPMVPMSYTGLGQAFAAGADVLDGAIRYRGKPDWALHAVKIDGKSVKVNQQLILHRAFGNLVHFKRHTTRKDPKILVVAPMSGHHASLLRGTVKALLPEHDVYVTDWIDARTVAHGAGRFGLDEYIDYLMDFLRELGDDVHVIAVCQPAPLVLATVALMAAAKDSCQPLSMTLMGGPIDTTAAETEVTKLAASKPLSWFKRHLIAKVPLYYPGATREVYPGFMQLGAFISMNAMRHVNAHVKMFQHLIVGDGDSASAHRRFYDEYLSVMDITAEFYLETVDCVFQKHHLANGTMRWRDQVVDPALIRKTALMTVEGELDDISAPGQTYAAHALCSSIPKKKKSHYLQEKVGHYGIFNGRRWRENIVPRITDFIRSNDPAF